MAKKDMQKKSDPSGERSKIGVDNRNESASRYGKIPYAESMEEGGRERKFQEEERGLEPLEDDIELSHGYGAKTEGAYGKDHSGPGDPLNARYRSQEGHDTAQRKKPR